MVKRRRREAAQLSVSSWADNNFIIWAEKLENTTHFLPLTLIYNVLPSNHGLALSLVHHFFLFLLWAEWYKPYRKPQQMSHTHPWRSQGVCVTNMRFTISWRSLKVILFWTAGFHHFQPAPSISASVMIAFMPITRTTTRRYTHVHQGLLRWRRRNRLLCRL